MTFPATEYYLLLLPRPKIYMNIWTWTVFDLHFNRSMFQTRNALFLVPFPTRNAIETVSRKISVFFSKNNLSKCLKKKALKKVESSSRFIATNTVLFGTQNLALLDTSVDLMWSLFKYEKQFAYYRFMAEFNFNRQSNWIERTHGTIIRVILLFFETISI